MKTDTVFALFLVGIVVGSLLIYLAIQPHTPYLYTMPNACPWIET